jgi:cytochrome c oxidase cbb3-type subunit 3
MNCAGCHGYTAEGAMGPDLTDTYWRYGGTPAEIYKSIYEGRPQGMPAWGRALPAREIWEVVAYIESLGGSFPAVDYQAARQGDKRHENAAPETREKAE